MRVADDALNLDHGGGGRRREGGKKGGRRPDELYITLTSSVVDSVLWRRNIIEKGGREGGREGGRGQWERFSRWS